MKANFITYGKNFGRLPTDGQDIFFGKFKRKFKDWTIDELHDLWLRTCSRASIRQKEKSDFIDEVVKEIPKNDRGRHIIYFYHRNDKKNTHQYEISWNHDWKGYGISQNRVELKTRDEKLTFILAKQREFELGQKYHHLDYMCTRAQYYVKDILWRMVEEKLQAKFKDSANTIPDIFILDIGSKKYFIELDSQHRYGYLRFHMKNEYTGENFINLI